ncbi:MAG: hypothetical protein A3I61_17915 [Acidobacteria bacterium RIFCSPLOWO2_02_FULL_68_18]|nr:MAG: hypothetical protein A3I61_17915 [Acidobacteria bacterium RIFCSPLOWO2_02_FULL_68_18]OFW51492.1 MAG: hypothetical protein A3G77_18360 [Acidobacteria bacterium RIFCSPLOWO2_12_FULL_68_19]
MATPLAGPVPADPSPTAHLPRGRRVRVNVTCEGTLIALTDSGAVVRLPRPPRPHTQTTLAIEGLEGTQYLPAHVVSAVPEAGASQRIEYRVALTFLTLSSDAAAAVARLLLQN